MSSFLEDTTPRPDPTEPSRFHGHLDDEWSVIYAFGGATMAATLRAMDAANSDAELRLVAAHAQFLSPVRTGPYVVDTEVVRAGRSVAQIGGRLRARGDSEPAVLCSGTWARPRPEDPVAGRGVQPPAVPGPQSEELRRLVHEPPWDRFPIHAKFEELQCPGFARPNALFIDGEQPESAVWTRLSEHCRHEDGWFEATALAVLADRATGPHLGPCIAPPSGSNIPPRPAVTLELALRIYGDPVTDWLLLHGRIDEARNGHLATRVDLWDEDRQLIATAEQLARYGSTPIDC